MSGKPITLYYCFIPPLEEEGAIYVDIWWKEHPYIKVREKSICKAIIRWYAFFAKSLYYGGDLHQIIRETGVDLNLPATVCEVYNFKYERFRVYEDKDDLDRRILRWKDRGKRSGLYSPFGRKVAKRMCKNIQDIKDREKLLEDLSKQLEESGDKYLVKGVYNGPFME